MSVLAMDKRNFGVYANKTYQKVFWVKCCMYDGSDEIYYCVELFPSYSKY